MPTWVVILINGILLAYTIFMFVFGKIMKQRKIKAAKVRLKQEMEVEENERSKTTKENA